MLGGVILGAQTSHLGGLAAPFGHPGEPCGRSGGPRGHPIGPMGGQIWIFIDFWLILGPPWEPLGAHLGDFSVIWDTEMSVSVPGWVFK